MLIFRKILYNLRMITLLSRIFIKNHEKYMDEKVRRHYGILCSTFGIFLNILLFVSKLIGAMVTKSVAIFADSFNNLSDAASSFVSVLGFKLAGKKPDEELPFGHGRIEYISGLIVSFLILLMGIELFKTSIESIMSQKKIEYSLFSVIIMAASVLIKLYMYTYNHSIAKKIKSPSMEAVAIDSFSDMISTSIVIISIIAGRFTNFPLDGIGGLIVAVFIFRSGIKSCKETIDPLLGLPPEKELVEKVEKETLKFSPIVAIHDLVVHDYGPGRLMISLHAEVPGDRNIFELHEVIDKAELALAKKFNCNAVIHMDPIDTGNERLGPLKKLALEEAHKIDERFTIHDVRLVPGEKQTNLIFDIVRPHDSKISVKELKRKLTHAIRQRECDINCVITVDSPYVQ